jgi:3-isopropylmalate/(R)-2-methylmalate dehydratase small subunit
LCIPHRLVQKIEEEYIKLGSYALCGLPDTHTERYVQEGEYTTEYPIIIGADNFGCGSSREHAPISLGAAGCKAVIANSFARIFFRNSIATGEIYPIDSTEDLTSQLKTGDEISIDTDAMTVTLPNGKIVQLKPLGDVKDVIDAGGIFNYARQEKMI